MNDHLYSYPDINQLARDLSLILSRQISQAVKTNGACHLVIPGGTSPRRVLEMLREHDVPWTSVHIYPSDERCVPKNAPERNDRLIDELLIPYVPIREECIHRIPAELGAIEGAQRYSQLLKSTSAFDIVLLGVGKDGHTASLFPDHPAVADDRDAVPVLGAPKPPSSRVSIGLKRLQRAKNRHVIVIGYDKLEQLTSPQDNARSPVKHLDAILWYAPLLQ